MSVKSFKFVSPGVFINEIDNSFIPKSANAIGPVVIGRATRGLAMTPVKVESYSQFVEMFGDTVPGNGGGDIYRDGNYQSPMYGTYAAKAFMNANVAPLTFVRLLGEQNANKTSGGENGWKTAVNVGGASLAAAGGAVGLWVFQSGSALGDSGQLGTGSLAAVWYGETAGTLLLSGTLAGAMKPKSDITNEVNTASLGAIIETDSNNLFTVVATGSGGVSEKITFGFDDTQDTFIRKVFNTNPQLTTTAGTFYPAESYKHYWLGESFEQNMRTRYSKNSVIAGESGRSLVGTGSTFVGQPAFGVMLPIALESATSTGPHNMQGVASRPEAKAGWFVGQHLGTPASFVATDLQKLFRLKGRGHGEWLQRNAKVSIEKVRQSNTKLNPYGSFSVVLRALSDTDSKIQVLERFDGVNLNPASPDYIARRIGDKYAEWDSTNRILKTYGEYDNLSKFVYVEMDQAVDGGASGLETLLPFGYYGPPKFSDILSWRGLSTGGFITGSGGTFGGAMSGSNDGFGSIQSNLTSSVLKPAYAGRISGSFAFPINRLRHSASDGGLSDQTNAYFGFQTTRSPDSTIPDSSVADMHRLLYAGLGDDPSAGGITGVDGFSYIFTLDDVKHASGSTNAYYYCSGSRKAGSSVTSASYTDLLNKDYNRFTAPFWGGFDGFDIHNPDPLYNAGMTEGASTELNNYIYNTWKRAVDTVADPEALDVNMMLAPGLTFDALTGHMVNVCEERADAMALIDLSSVYTPAHEAYNASKSARVGPGAVSAANNLRDRQIDSSYGATFYPWVQTRDDQTGRMLWIPPSVAMAGVLASSQAKSDVWFAPAGFNRGGLSDGAAGIPVTGITERLTSKDRDTLYEARINPIASFPSSGIVVFGQKTLQERASALDRINVRRLVIYLKKQISVLSTQVLFEQNVQATWNRFKALIEPFLANVKVQFGITDYKLILDESTTTPDLIDQNIMYAKIMIKPARAIEYIAIDFVVASTGASFDD